jgi:hypothetical protein
VEKQGKVKIFCGLNAVGKTTLSQLMINRLDYKLFSDNYTLIDERSAYFSPDPVRISKDETVLLGTEKFYTGEDFGFGKRYVSGEKHMYSDKDSAEIEAIYLVTRGDGWVRRKVKKDELIKKILNLQVTNGEDVRYAKASQLDGLAGKNTCKFPNCDYYELTMGPVEQFGDVKV